MTVVPAQAAFETSIDGAASHFCEALVSHGFSGDVATDAATRTVFATDNSIYQLRPQAVLYPRTEEDLALAARLASAAPKGQIALTARGGGTGTNGQSLTSGIVIDTSRHMNRILSLDLDSLTVTVEPGVVLNQLNAFLAPHGLFFPPTVSTASRATLGGMVATDASGKGSRLYGKTSDYIDAMQIVLANGDSLAVEALDAAQLDQLCDHPGPIGAIHREVRRVVCDKAALIEATFPKMNRGLTGYNLQHVTDPDGKLRLSYLLAGSEGTLALTSRLRLRLLPLPKLKALVCIRYAAFETALADVQRLLAAEPLAIEILDDKVLALARQDEVWTALEQLLGGETAAPVEGFNVVEFVGETQAEIDAALARLEDLLQADPALVLDWTVVRDPHLMRQVWSLREKSVGLMGRLGGSKQGTAFVEDVAVPPEHLAPFVREFRAILDQHNLTYGMYGHADVGCLHVRPALDMKRESDAALIRPISDAVAELAKRYGGLLWGEHGRGFRGEYSPFFFGPDLYAELCAIKKAFDPLNILNPGKLAVPDETATIDRIDAVAMRGSFDSQINNLDAVTVADAIACNGNGACHNWDAADPMCPSFKVTGDRLQSPKGRAALLREWARQKSDATISRADKAELETQVKTALDTCLSCKACAGQCPVKVDIPSMKSRFLDQYYSTRRRPLRDLLVASFEPLAMRAARMPWLSNALVQSRLGKAIADNLLGLVDLPKFQNSTGRKTLGIKDFKALADLPEATKQQSVILLQDTFNAAFDADTLETIEQLLQTLGLTVHRAAALPNGKAQHVLGFKQALADTAAKQIAHINALLVTGISVIAAEPVTLLMHDQEYRQAGFKIEGTVLSLEQFLADRIAEGKLLITNTATDSAPIQLMLHCSEKTARPLTAALWTRIFAAFGLPMSIPATGCCGMAGLFGHQSEHQTLSRDLFDASWRDPLSGQTENTLFATGFSCRCQTARFAHFKPRHPAAALLQALTQTL